MLVSSLLSTAFCISSQNLNTGTSGGEASTTIAAYTNPSYTQPLEQADQQQLPIGSVLYFGMTTQFPDPNFVLTVEKCFTTPTSDGSGSINVLLIQNGCPVGNEPNINVVENGVSKQVRFSIDSYAFPGYDNVYIFCSAHLCNTALESCSGCSTSRSADDSSTIEQFALGPFGFFDTVNSCSHTALSAAVLVGALLSPFIL
ncbi:pancreatic secretory granule membrane major glycoprotein GP2-like [Pelodytes ibericus]